MKRSRHKLDDLYLFVGLASLIIGLFLILLSVSIARAAAVPMTVRETTAMVRAGEHIRRDVAVVITDIVTSAAGMKISADLTGGDTVDAQCLILSRWDIDGDGADPARKNLFRPSVQ